MPLCAGAASSLYLIALTNNAQMNRVAFANGQFMLMSRRAYDAIGGHVAVKDRYCEDVAIAELMKKHGLRPRVSWGNDYAAVRMYSSLPAIFRGWSRIYYAAQAGRPWRILIGITFLLLCGFSILPALAWGVYRLLHPGPTLFGSADWLPGACWLGAAVAHLLLMTGALATIYRLSGNPGRNALLFLRWEGRCCWPRSSGPQDVRHEESGVGAGTAYAHTMAPSLTGEGR